jgi:LuxR family maltose regulon positive regulatory protein
MTVRIELDLLGGLLHQARSHCYEAFDVANRLGDVSGSGYIHVWLGTLHFEWNELQDAFDHLRAGLTCGKQMGDAQLLLGSYARLFQIALILEDEATARDTLTRIEELLVRLGNSNFVAQCVSLVAQGYLQHSELALAERWLTRVELPLDDASLRTLLSHPTRYLPYLIQAQLLLFQQKSAEALAVLEAIRPYIFEKPYEHAYIQFRAFFAPALFLAGDLPQAGSVLLAALPHAAREEYTRLFINMGLPMARLLQAFLNEPTLTAQAPTQLPYIHRLLAAYPPAVRTVLAEEQRRPPGVRTPAARSGALLSARELDVVRLMAEGLSDREIAQRLVLTEHTVKSHARRIYTRLEVRNRLQAVERARRLALL